MSTHKCICVDTVFSVNNGIIQRRPLQLPLLPESHIMNIDRSAQIIVVSVVFFKWWQNSSWCVLALIYSSIPLQWAWGGLSVLLLQEACQDVFVHVSCMCPGYRCSVSAGGTQCPGLPGPWEQLSQLNQGVNFLQCFSPLFSHSRCGCYKSFEVLPISLVKTFYYFNMHFSIC